MEIVNTDDMRRMDAEAIHEYGIPGIVLMEHAAMAVMEYMRENIAADSRIMILCGPGNNGGDGFALARLLVEAGYTHVRIHCSVPYDRMSHDEAIYARIAESYGIEILQTQDMEILKPALDAADVVVDALFGTGLSRNIEGFYDVLILYLNLLHKHVISIDIASGVHGDTGKIMNCAVQSSVTITFECLKKGQLLYPGSSYCGDILVKKITLPKRVKEAIRDKIHLLDEDIVKSFLPKRDPHSNKGSFGKVLMVGGSSFMHGAITLAAKAALLSGTGTLTLFLPDCITDIISMKLEESMLMLAPSMNGTFSMISVDLLKRNLDHYDLITIGNGMGRNEVTGAMVQAVLESNRPCLLDGDVLFEAGRMQELIQHRKAVTILTPHPKEMSYLCGCSVKEVLQDPLQCAQDFVRGCENVVLVLKDQHTIIAEKDSVYMNTAGNHALAKGGSGDVLCGILTGLYAQGKQPLQAAAAAVYVHASAADELIHHMDAYSIQPNDLITALSGVYGKLKNK